MSETENTGTRVREVIEKEYQQGCMALGDRKYRQAVLEAEITSLINKLSELNKEASDLEKAGTDAKG